MKALTNDIATYSVVYKVNGEMRTERFKSFAAAAGCASALNGLTRFLNVKFESPLGDSAWSGSMYCYSKDNTRRVCNPAMIKAVLERNGV